jgi:hypothetical protein
LKAVQNLAKQKERGEDIPGEGVRVPKELVCVREVGQVREPD